jgi:hypothetical protein
VSASAPAVTVKTILVEPVDFILVELTPSRFGAAGNELILALDTVLGSESYPLTVPFVYIVTYILCPRYEEVLELIANTLEDAELFTLAFPS